ncbi:MAG: sugar transferase [Verrucomicrobiota bacterium]|nr:sugar transferase [Verrucomicrobiota bacterium]
MKRLFDLFFALFLLMLFSPLFILAPLLIKLSSRGPIFYSHPRVGIHGKPFGCLKFRTMYPDAEKMLHKLLQNDPVLKKEWETYYKLKKDPRITPVGRWLRKTSLDEVPQILNVLFGEMSIVGPRPLTQEEVVHYLKEKAKKILSVRPGLTTLWIVKGRNQFTLEERISLEELYVERQSFWLDLSLIAKTALRVVFPKGAY